MSKLKKKYIRSIIKERKTISNKGDYGHALIIAGHKGYMGAAVIVAKSAIRSGLGLLTMSVPKEERSILQATVPAAMVIMREENLHHIDKFSAVGIGPGMGTDTISEALLIYVLKHFKKPLLLDADALTIISNKKKLMEEIPINTIITPHIREFDRLFGIHRNKADRIKTAIQKVKEYGIIIVLKDHCTIIVSAEKIFYNTTGNAGLAKGGSGDALTGAITSFLAQGYTPLNAANLGVYLHGLAADITLKKQSMESMMITDVIDNFGKAFKKIRE
jgi:hydroxyethylthiazole kinase-like uncharacterized protein yjeF